jgi:methylmalonyl-CoA/ethylmalonyl-CoA epimerase
MVDPPRAAASLPAAWSEGGVRSRFDHVAHAAPRIRDLLPVYQDLLGGTYHAGGPNRRVGYLAIQLSFPGGGLIELMEPLAGSEFFTRFFARQPAGGLHHVTYYVDAIAPAIERAAALGLEVVGSWFDRADYKEAFLHPRSNSGVLLQLVEVDAGYRSMGLGSSLDAVLANCQPAG